MRNLTLALGWTTFHLRVTNDACRAMAPVERFFRDAVHEGEPLAPDFVVEVDVWDAARAGRAQSEGEHIVMRRSSAAPFNFDVWRSIDGDRRVYANEHTVLDVPARCTGDGAILRIFVSEGSCCQVVDNLRDLAWRHEEHRGRVVLHAAAVCRDGRAVVVAGAKGAGKTTTMLAALRDKRWSYFSGDKVVAVPTDERILTAPWPDWPYVGVGTLRTEPRLAEWARAVDAGFDHRAPTEKLLLDPVDFSALYATAPLSARLPLGAMVLPRVAPGQGLSVRRVTDSAEKEAHLLGIVDRTSDATFFASQLHLVPSYARMYETVDRIRPLLADVEVVEVAGDVDRFDIDAIAARASEAAW